MDYSIETFKRFFNEKFVPEHFTSNDVDDLIYEIEQVFPKFDFTFETGATKCVIIPAKYDYVIKIPFDGEYKDRYIKNDDGEEEEEEEFIMFTGGGQEGWDYCDQECVYYEDIIKGSGYEKFFLSNKVLSFDWPIYTQSKAEIYVDAHRDTSKKSKELVKEMRKSIWTHLPNPWLELCLENFNYDVDKLKNFICFLDDNFSDLHKSNIGYLDNQAVIIDYAGYCE